MLPVLLATITQWKVCILHSGEWYLSNVGQRCTHCSEILPKA